MARLSSYVLALSLFLMTSPNPSTRIPNLIYESVTYILLSKRDNVWTETDSWKLVAQPRGKEYLLERERSKTFHFHQSSSRDALLHTRALPPMINCQSMMMRLTRACGYLVGITSVAMKVYRVFRLDRCPPLGKGERAASRYAKGRSR